MKPSDKYRPSSALGLLLVGPPGAGKSCGAIQAMPRPFICDADNNLRGPKNLLDKINPGKKFFYSTIDEECLDPNKRWEYACAECEKALKDKEVGSIIIDSLSKISDYLLDHITFTQGRDRDSEKDGLRQSDWGIYKRTLPHFITTLRSWKKPVVVIAHEEYVKDEVSQRMIFRINIPGSNAYDFAKWFTDYYHAEIRMEKEKNPPAGQTPKDIVRYVVRTAPSEVGTFKRSFDCPNVTTLNEQLFKDLNFPSEEPVNKETTS